MPPPERRSQTVSFVQPRLHAGGISEEEKSQCHAVRRHFSQTKICVSTFCQGARGRRSELLASFSEESQSLMGPLFHSICRPASYRPRLHTCEPVTVALHTSLQPASCTLPLTADTSCSFFRRTDDAALNCGNETAGVTGWCLCEVIYWLIISRTSWCCQLHIHSDYGRTRRP